MDLAPGTLLASRYRVVKAVGHGATGTIYRGQDELLGERVALKVLRDDVAARHARARRWVRLARRVTHPNVCRIHDYVEDGPWRILVMEFVKGCDLRLLIRQRGPLPAELAYDIAIQVAQGLAAIHAAGIVHRDLTARNVLYDVAGRVKVTDFGFARRLRSRSSRLAGKPEYLSPEQARGERVDPRSDLYTLGVLIFEMLTGVPPFRGATREATLHKQMYEPPPLAGRRAGRLPLRLLPVLEKVLSKRPQDRYASADRMAAALRAARSAGEVVVMEPGPVPWALTSQAPDANPWAEMPLAPRTALGVVAVTAAVAVAVIGAWLAMRSSPSVPAAPRLPVARIMPTAPPAQVAAAGASTAEQPVPAVREGSARRGAPSPAAREELAPPAAETVPVTDETVTPVGAEGPSEGASAAVEQPGPAGATPEPAGPTAEPGRLQIGVRPWAAVTIDGRPMGETPLAPLALAPGVHTARLDHPAYRPFLRKVTVPAGQTVRLQVDLGLDAIRR